MPQNRTASSLLRGAPKSAKSCGVNAQPLPFSATRRRSCLGSLRPAAFRPDGLPNSQESIRSPFIPGFKSNGPSDLKLPSGVREVPRLSWKQSRVVRRQCSRVWMHRYEAFRPALSVTLFTPHLACIKLIDALLRRFECQTAGGAHLIPSRASSPLERFQETVATRSGPFPPSSANSKGTSNLSPRHFRSSSEM
jgi:hypothetical protein